MRQSPVNLIGSVAITIAPAAALYGYSRPLGFGLLLFIVCAIEIADVFMRAEDDLADFIPAVPFIDTISDEEAEADREALKAAAFDHMTSQLTPDQLDRLLELWLCGSEGSEIDPAFAYGDWQLQTRGLVDLVSDRVIVVTKIGEGVLIHARYILPPENRPGRDTPAARAIFAPYPRRVSR